VVFFTKNPLIVQLLEKQDNVNGTKIWDKKNFGKIKKGPSLKT
jgi:hypothetical protein